MSPWQRLDAELDAWRIAGRRAALWCRDDDACADSPALRRLLAIGRDVGVPVALAAIPALVEPSLADAILQSESVTVVQHGFAHRNHAPAGERKRELGSHRPVSATMAELAGGLEKLRRIFARRFAAVLVPPWNRIDGAIVAQLAPLGFTGLSTLGSRITPHPVPGILQCNAHVDLIDWRKGRSFIGAEAAIERVIHELRARREGTTDAAEPTGVLTHHLDMRPESWTFVMELVTRTREHGAVWQHVDQVFSESNPGGLISGRSA